MKFIFKFGLILLFWQTLSVDAATVTKIAAGGNHSLFVKSDGSLWAMGWNYYGQLGNGSSNYYYGQINATTPFNTNLPEQIVSSDVVSVVSGARANFTLFIKSDGSLWAMGDNFYGQLGDGTTPSEDMPILNNTNRPEQIVSSGVVTAAAGAHHTLFVKMDGSLWAMGFNNFGELGDGTFTSTNRPKQIVPSGVIAVAAGEDHSLFIKSDGSLWAMGYNHFGQLGNGDETFADINNPIQIVSNGVVAVAAASNYSLFLKSDGSLWGMGENNSGQLGDGFIFSNSEIPEQIYPSPPPQLKATICASTNLQFTATCKFGGTFYLKSSMDISQPLDEWAPVWTNSVNIRTNNNFNVILTNKVTSTQQHFYILESR